ncbi:MAG: hypothetical protein V2A76_02380 [Planctomycetota bacterium]
MSDVAPDMQIAREVLRELRDQVFPYPVFVTRCAGADEGMVLQYNVVGALGRDARDLQRKLLRKIVSREFAVDGAGASIVWAHPREGHVRTEEDVRAAFGVVFDAYTPTVARSFTISVLPPSLPVHLDARFKEIAGGRLVVPDFGLVSGASCPHGDWTPIGNLNAGSVNFECIVGPPPEYEREEAEEMAEAA